jgi:hypothetical protein
MNSFNINSVEDSLSWHSKHELVNFRSWDDTIDKSAFPLYVLIFHGR